MTPLVCNPVLETESIKYSVQAGCHWLDKRYFAGTKNAHTGIDLNATTGGNTDYGNLVRACADGVVIEAGQFPDWGGIVLIYHPELKVYTQYAHLFGITVKAGQSVRMADKLGQIGRGEHEQFSAHLHFEVRKSKLAASYWPSSHVQTRAAAERFIREHYLDPEVWLEQHKALRTLAEVQRVAKAGQATHSAKPPAQEPNKGKPIYLWVQVQNPDGTLRPKEVVSIPVNEQGLLLVQANGKPKVVRVPESRLTEGEY